MVNNLESTIWDARDIINNSNKLSNPQYYLPIVSEIQHMIFLYNARFHEGIKRKRVPFAEIERYMNLDSIIIDGCSTTGNIEITRILKFREKDVSNVIDIVCIDQQRTIEQRDIVTKYIEMRGYKYEFLPNNVYGFGLSLNGEELIIPNLYGIYSYIKADLLNLKLYIMIDTEGNLLIKKSGLEHTLYFYNFGLFSLFYKFFRYKDRDIKDLEEYENRYRDKIKEIISKGFNERDLNNLRKVFNEIDIDKITRNLDRYIEKHPDSVYENLYNIIERVY
ncbi:hypothetical protein Nps_02655 [Candidatus Nanopusillus acidilobi]|nr:hypothetical protein Nps_02655 [Candidatus Nanopusillus acidilobi]